ncbi:MAG: mechanosensitive ion channel domain-containing protein [Candidatus Malihini olakiniferum]
MVNISDVDGGYPTYQCARHRIQLSDRSTVIVPNSQFLSQNVRNITMDNAMG